MHIFILILCALFVSGCSKRATIAAEDIPKYYDGNMDAQE